jgi:mannose/fructose/N-acetylgalactosamine-specific phosphotransferase system component IID
LTKYVCSPNTSLSCGTMGWFSGMGSASNWPSVCSICVDVSAQFLSVGSFAGGIMGAVYVPFKCWVI